MEILIRVIQRDVEGGYLSRFNMGERNRVVDYPIIFFVSKFHIFLYTYIMFFSVLKQFQSFRVEGKSGQK